MDIAYVFTPAASGGWGHMNGYGQAGWMWFWGPVMMLVWIAAIAVAVWLVVRVTDVRQREAAAPSQNAREILAERYARGEISTEEYDERLAKLA